MPPPPATAQAPNSLPVLIAYQQKPAEGLVHLSWWQADQFIHSNKVVVILESSSARVAVPFTFPVRGNYDLPRLTLRCDYPLGLFKCWTHLDLDQQVTVYPFPKKCETRLYSRSSDEVANASHRKKGFDEFYSLREFQDTDSLNTVAWKHVAKNNEWRVKTFEDPVSLTGWLTMDSCQSNLIESQLSELTHQIQVLSDTNQTFGLAIPGVSIKPSQGDAHKHICLTALASYPSSVYSINKTTDNSSNLGVKR